MDFARSTLKARIKEQLAVVRCRARARRLQAAGFQVVNPYFDQYGAVRGRALTQGLSDIIGPVIGQQPTKVLLELGCGDGRRVTPSLKTFAHEIWGVDLLPGDEVVNCDRYFQADPAAAHRALRDVADEAIDLVVVFNLTGFHATTQWPQYTGPGNSRLYPYLGADVLPRVVRKGGYLVFIEWEAQPELRVGLRSLRDVNRELDVLYGRPSVPGFELVQAGFAQRFASPFAVLQRAAI